jgi:hypothetical protein
MYLIFFLAWLCLFPSVASSKNLEEDTASISSPRALTEWLSSDFQYAMEIPDAWQSPQETVSLKRGDCEDFAILASAVLWRLGIPNEILIIKFKKLKIGHAICIWKDKDGFYKFISNQKMYDTGKDRIEDAIGKLFPDWESIAFVGQRKEYTKVISRK